MTKKKKLYWVELTPEQATSLSEYQFQLGDRWKQQLRLDWMRAGSALSRVEWGPLQQLRNQVGNVELLPHFMDGPGWLPAEGASPEPSWPPPPWQY